MPSGLRLNGVLESHAELAAVAEQALANCAWSSGVVMISTSRIPASISVDSG